MSIPDKILQRWKANTSALGIRLTDEDIERIAATGLGDRLTMVEDIIQGTGSRDVVPDYLAETRPAGEHDE